MTRFGRITALFAVALVVVMMVCFIQARAGDAGRLFSASGMVASHDGRLVYVSSDRSAEIAVWDTRKHKRISMLSTSRPVHGLTLSSDGRKLYSAEGDADGELVTYNSATGIRLSSYTLGHTPMSPALYNQGKTAAVCLRFDNVLALVDLTQSKITAKIRCLREPVAVGVTTDGMYAVVANHLPTQPANAHYVAAGVTIVNLKTRKAIANIMLPNGSSGVRGLAISPDGKYAYVTHIIARYGMPTTQLDRGWMNTNALSVIDITGRCALNTVLLDDVDMGSANPWAVAVSPDGRRLLVSSAGTHELTIIDRMALHRKIEAVASGKLKTETVRNAGMVPDDLAFLNGIRQRIPLKGVGPRAMCVSGTNVYIADAFSQDVELYQMGKDAVTGCWPLVKKQAMSQSRRGEMLFNDGTMCYQNWQSCASCHPDSRVDGFNWDNQNDGIGNPKNTRTMLLSHKTPPVMSLGVRDKAETAVRAGIKFIEYATRPEADAKAIDSYLSGMQPVKSPYLQHGQLSKAAQRGKKLFQQAGCINCHPAPLYTSMSSHNVGTGVYLEADSKFDTSSLVEVWRTAPYLNDGSAPTILSVLTTHNRGDRHGVTSNLNKRQLSDLAEYVLSL